MILLVQCQWSDSGSKPGRQAQKVWTIMTMTVFRSCDGPCLMKMSDVEATGSGGSRAKDSEARPQVACYGARPGGRPRRPGRAKPQRHLLNKERDSREMYEARARGDCYWQSPLACLLRNSITLCSIIVITACLAAVQQTWSPSRQVLQLLLPQIHKILL